MENDNQYDQVLVRYLFNEATNEEVVFVENWLNSAVENKHYFERLRSIWRLVEIQQHVTTLLDTGTLEDKWQLFEEKLNESQVTVLPKKEVVEPYNEENISFNRPSLIRKIVVNTAIAASVLLVMGLSWMFFTNDNIESPVVRHRAVKTDIPTYIAIHEVNTTGKDKRLLLPDSSVVLLADKSEVLYRQPFVLSRDILVKGKARFKVAKDKTRPFIVTSGDISTTALGTEFTVTAFEGSRHIVVKLYEGKVVVKPLNERNRKMKKEVVLLPGQEFVYNNQAFAKVRSFKTKPSVVSDNAKPETNLDNPSIPKKFKTSWYMFNNQPLDLVLKQLTQMYDVKIVYNKKDVQKLYFIGQFNKTDTIETILDQIALSNKLIVTKKDSTFFIRK